MRQKSTCSIPECGKPVHGRGWCSQHYQRWKACGSPTCSKPRYAPADQLFWSHVDRSSPDGCWEWSGAKYLSGHGNVNWHGSNRGAHRVAFFLTHGYWPNVCCHHCDNPACVRPDHLYDGTKSSNLRDMYERSPTAHARRRKAAETVGKVRVKLHGEDNPQSKLTIEQVQAIREAYAAGDVTQKALAIRLGVSRSTIGRVVSGDSWRSLQCAVIALEETP